MRKDQAKPYANPREEVNPYTKLAQQLLELKRELEKIRQENKILHAQIEKV